MIRRRNLITPIAATVLACGMVACSDDAPSLELASDDGAAVVSRGPGPPGPDDHAPTEGHQPGGGYGRAADESDAEPDEQSGEETTAPESAAEAADEIVAVDVALTEDDIDGLLWMREEEQLAHDVYVTLGEEWGVRVFENIAASEQGHIARVTGLLERYGIDDPMAEQPAGSFTIPEMQALHDQLVGDGSESLVAALSVGAFIEETDIADLRELAAGTDVAAITDAYAMLERGSRNHLRAFTSQLAAQGVTYAATVLDVADYDEIVSSPMERGRDARGRRDH